MAEKVEGWHWLPQDMRLRFPPYTLVEPGQTLSVDEDKLYICHYGLHASRLASQALFYAPGYVIERVTLSGHIVEISDKLCASQRTCHWLAHAEKTLHEFTLWLATEVGGDDLPEMKELIAAKKAWLLDNMSLKELQSHLNQVAYARFNYKFTAAHTIVLAAMDANARIAVLNGLYACNKAFKSSSTYYPSATNKLHEMLMALAPKET